MIHCGECAFNCIRIRGGTGRGLRGPHGGRVPRHRRNLVGLFFVGPSYAFTFTAAFFGGFGLHGLHVSEMHHEGSRPVLTAVPGEALVRDYVTLHFSFPGVVFARKPPGGPFLAPLNTTRATVNAMGIVGLLSSQKPHSIGTQSRFALFASRIVHALPTMKRVIEIGHMDWFLYFTCTKWKVRYTAKS